VALGAESQVEEAIGQEPAREELHRQVVHTLPGPRLGVLQRRHPALDELVAHGECGGVEPVAWGGSDRVLAEQVEAARSGPQKSAVGHPVGGVRRRRKTSEKQRYARAQ
jgi:hypothetical protein